MPPSAHPAPAAHGRAEAVRGSRRWMLGGCILIFVAALAAYQPAWQGGFLWDDDGHVTRADLRPAAGLQRIWFEPGATQQYYPLLHTAFWLEYHLWGENAAAYHLLNVLLHASAACLVAAVLQRLRLPGAWLAAGLFALHPVMVESVAWISEQKNTLSAVFLLGALLAWLRFDERRAPGAYAGASACFLAALLTKSVTATLPAALLVIAWWRRGRLAWRDLGPLLPWLVAGIGFGLYTAHFERTQIGAGGAEFTLGLVERGLLAGRAFWFYLGKLAWPAELLFFYPRWDVDAAAAWQYLFPAAALVLGALAWGWRRRSRGPLAALLLFTGGLFPVLGFLNVYPFVFSYVADHFQYHASLVVFAAVAAAAVRAAPALPPTAHGALAGVLLFALGARTWAHARDFRSNEVLLRATLAGNPDCWVAHHNLAFELAKDGRLEEANAHLQRVLALRPASAPAENNLGDNLTRLGRPREALPHLQRALQLQPRYVEARTNVGTALLELNEVADAIRAFEAALALDPEFALAQAGLGRALAMDGRTAEALPHLARAVELSPENPEICVDYGYALLLAGRAGEAVPQFSRAVQLQPGMAPAHHLLGRAFGVLGRWKDAVAELAEAARLDPAAAEIAQELAAARRKADGR